MLYKPFSSTIDNLAQPTVRGNIETHIEDMGDKYLVKLMCSTEADKLSVKASQSGIAIAGESPKKGAKASPEVVEVLFTQPINHQQIVASKPKKEALVIEVPKLGKLDVVTVPVSNISIEERKFLKSGTTAEKKKTASKVIAREGHGKSKGKAKRDKGHLRLMGVK